MEEIGTYSSSFWDYIDANVEEDLTQLALKLNKMEVDFSKLFAMLQIKARQRVKSKLPTWVQNKKILFPKILSAEQCSSELTALYKNSFLQTGELAIDLTGGMGVDAWAFSTKYKKIIYVEQDEKLVQFAKYNFNVLGIQNIHCIHATSEDFLSAFDGKADLVYIDPARRSLSGSKVFRFEDCSPNVADLLPIIQEKSKRLLLKASPMMDIHQGIQDLGSVKKVVVLAKKNEVKELLFELDFQVTPSDVRIEAVNLKNESEDLFRFFPKEEKDLEIEHSPPMNWLYEPNAAILKSGAYKSISQQYEVKKLHPNTHLYTSETLVENFPGRVFSILDSAKYSKKDVARLLPEKKAVISTRNFPDSPEKMYKKLKLKEGGTFVLFGLRLFDNTLTVLKVRPYF